MEFEILLGVVIALISLIGVLITFLLKSRKTNHRLVMQCGFHSVMEARIGLIESSVNDLKIKLASFNTRLDGISGHVTRIESKIDILLNK